MPVVSGFKCTVLEGTMHCMSGAWGDTGCTRIWFDHVLVWLHGTVQLRFSGLLSIVEPNESIFHAYGDGIPCFSKAFLSKRNQYALSNRWPTIFLFPNNIFISLGLTCTEQNFITKAGFQQAAAEHGLIVVAPDTSPRKFSQRHGHSHTLQCISVLRERAAALCWKVCCLLESEFDLTSASCVVH